MFALRRRRVHRSRPDGFSPRRAPLRRRSDGTPSSAATAGFTLLEVMVAMAILGYSVVALIEVFGHGLRTTQMVAKRTHMALEARRILDQVLRSQSLEELEDEGQDEERNLAWQISVVPLYEDEDPFFETLMTPGESADTNPFSATEPRIRYQVDVWVRWPAENPSAAFQLTTFRAQKEPAAGGGF